MYVTSLKIQNFKSFENVTIHFNKDINVFTGVNNSGKTTCLEALALWNECFTKLLRQAGRANTKLRLEKDDFQLGSSQPIYIPFKEINSVRSPEFSDIFHNLDRRNSIILELTLLTEPNSFLKIGFGIRAADGGQNYEITLIDRQTFDYKHFNKFFKKLPDSISVVYASPIATLKGEELFMTIPVIKNALNERDSVVVLRNRIYQLKKDAKSFLDFQRDLSFILTDHTESIEIQTLGDETRDIHVKVNVKIGAKDTFKNISLLGSGTLQILEILLSLYENKRELNIILLDEPDSHIHRSIQQRLIEVMKKFVGNTQLFITTHNENLIRSFEPRYLFHFEPKANKEYRNILNDRYQKIKKGLQPSATNVILKSLNDGYNSLDFINALECDKLILVEGDDDARNLSILLQQRIQDKNKYMFWSFEGISGIFNNIKYYKEIFSLIKNQSSLWDKAVLIFDKDEFTDQQREELEKAFNDQLDIKTHIWKSYTFETTLLSNHNKLISLIEKYLRSLDLTVSTESIINTVEERLQEYCETKLAEWQNISGAYKNEYFHRIKNEKRSKIEDLFKGKGSKIITTNDGMIQSTFEAYLKSVCTPSDIHKLAKKDLIQAIMSEILLPFERTFDIENDFIGLLSCVDKSTWQDDWDFLLSI